jgi:hypothetical protein
MTASTRTGHLGGDCGDADHCLVASSPPLLETFGSGSKACVCLSCTSPRSRSASTSSTDDYPNTILAACSSHSNAPLDHPASRVGTQPDKTADAFAGKTRDILLNRACNVIVSKSPTGSLHLTSATGKAPPCSQTSRAARARPARST